MYRLFLFFLSLHFTFLFGFESVSHEIPVSQIINCFKKNDVRDFENIEFISDSQLYLIAKDVFYLHERSVRSASFQLGGYREVIAGAVLIGGGVLLLRYPPPIRTAGMKAIELGIGLVGIEYLGDCIQYLMNKGIIEDKDKKRLEEAIREMR